jgi:hypothetical protein
MASKMKSFRANENVQFMLNHYTEYTGVSEAKLIEMALDWFYRSGMCAAYADAKYKANRANNHPPLWDEMAFNASSDGNVRAIVRRSNGLGVAPVTTMK